MCTCAFDEDKWTHCDQPSHNPPPYKCPSEAWLVCALAVRRGIQPCSLQTAGKGFVVQLQEGSIVPTRPKRGGNVIEYDIKGARNISN